MYCGVPKDSTPLVPIVMVFSSVPYHVNPHLSSTSNQPSSAAQVGAKPKE